MMTERHDRHYMTPRECAERLQIPRVTAQYIRCEIRDGLLTAEIIHRPVRAGRQTARPIIRIYESDFQAYVQKYWPRFYDRLFPPAA